MREFGDDTVNSYINVSFVREQKSRGPLPRDKAEFVKAVWGVIAVRLGEGHEQRTGTSPTTEEMGMLLEEFQLLIHAAMDEDRTSKSNGQKATAFKGLAERVILTSSIRKVIDDNRPPRRKREKYSSEFEEMTLAVEDSKSPDPVNITDMILQADALHRSLAELDLKDQEILRMFMEGQISQTGIAEAMGMPLQTINRRFNRALERLESKLQWSCD